MTQQHHQNRALPSGSPVFAFDQAVDSLAEEGAFLTLGPDRQAARYVAEAHRVLDDVRTAMHRLEVRAADTTLRKRARKRLHGMAAVLAEAGLRDVERVRASAERLRARPIDPAAGWGTNLRVQTTRGLAWGVEKWTGSPLAAVELRSTRTAATVERNAELVAQRGRASRSRLRTGLIVGGGAVGAAVVGGASLAAYGAWSLVGLILGIG